MDPELDEIRFYLRNEKVKQIIALMEKNDKLLATSEISKQLKIHHDTLKKYFIILEKLKVLELELDNDKSSYILKLKSYYEVLESIKI